MQFSKVVKMGECDCRRMLRSWAVTDNRFSAGYRCGSRVLVGHLILVSFVPLRRSCPIPMHTLSALTMLSSFYTLLSSKRLSSTTRMAWSVGSDLLPYCFIKCQIHQAMYRQCPIFHYYVRLNSPSHRLPSPSVPFSPPLKTHPVPLSISANLQITPAQQN